LDETQLLVLLSPKETCRPVHRGGGVPAQPLGRAPRPAIRRAGLTKRQPYAGVVLTLGVLGPLEVAVDGRPVRLTTGRLQTLLVVLAMAAGAPLSVDRLAAALWDGDLPDNARRVVQTYLGRLRSTLGAGLIVTEPVGYRLRVDPEQVDALRFTRLLDAAARAADPASQRARLAAALALWRGDPFDGVASDWLARTEKPRLAERYLTAVERHIDLDLADGRHRELVSQLSDLTARHPLREPLWVRLLVALDRCGRQAEALAQYETIRRRLAEELGTEPGPELREIHAGLLAGGQSRPEPVRAAGPVVPRQLPTAVDGFTGRTDALKALDALLGDRDAPSTTAVVISAIAGTAGVGKTALAVHWAHRVADRFPDGQLYVNLRGFGPSGQAMTPTEAIRGLLAALGADQPPSDLEGQVGLYRSLLAGRRMLVMLDNAHDADQVRPLLPGSPTCMALVTSRNQLTSLVATENAQPLALDLMSADEARHLLAGRLGPERTAAELAATDEIITWCARLPLALAIAAAHAAAQPSFPLAALTAQLRDEGSRLDLLATGDPTSDIRAVFSWSYRALSPDAARLFPLLGLCPGPDISAPAAASLAALPVAHVRRLLVELCRAQLLTEHLPGRYAFHDLLRTYAAELAQARDDRERTAARHRLLDHYLHTAYAAAGLLNPSRGQIALAPAQPGVVPEQLGNDEQAAAWFAAEHRILVAAVGHAATIGFDTHAWQLACTIMAFLYGRGAWDEWLATEQAALAAARRLSDQVGQAVSHRGIAMACANLGRFADAQLHLMHALAGYGELGDQVGQAHIRLHLSALLSRQRRHRDALREGQQALDGYLAAGDLLGEALACNTMGYSHAGLGDYQPALAYCQRAALLFQQLGDRIDLASTWDSLGYVHHRMGDYREAIRYYRCALDLFGKLGRQFLRAETLANLGDTYLAAGEPAAAQTAWRHALEMFDESAQRQAAVVRAKLATLPDRSAG
jgi:DNA-binding SARP family transcriptional activator/tetratricopeptide (TPR) repeat protein